MTEGLGGAGVRGNVRRIGVGRVARRASCRYSTASKAPVAQLDRASDYESEGRAFESLRARQFFQYLQPFRPGLPFEDFFSNGIPNGVPQRSALACACVGVRSRCGIGVERCSSPTAEVLIR